MPTTHQEHPELPFRQYRGRRGTRTIWAKRMPKDFSFRVPRGRVDQRKAGARAIVEFVQIIEGRAGDYLVITDLGTGQRRVRPGPEFESAFFLIESA